MDYYAVVGNPIAHSKSPKIHALFATQLQQTMDYSTLEAPIDGFPETIKQFFGQPGNKGLNVTVPFKEQAWDICDLRSERAELAGAVNTLYLDPENGLVGDNTDGIGLVTDLKINHQIPLKNKKILIVGAGGAVRGVLQPILKELPAEIVVCNRTVSKADALAELFKATAEESGCEIRSSSFEGVSGEFDIIINGTSASLSGELPRISEALFSKGPVVYDMMYSQGYTVFNQWAIDSGASQVIDGLGMLIEQAAEAFAIWRGVRPDTTEALSALRA